ncbi:MAG: DUF2085 domain-containing protein [Ignavibacteria bacterium]|nr:DUF2085 domain-containing protein [Ignavibacteria bacterium]
MNKKIYLIFLSVSFVWTLLLYLAPVLNVAGGFSATISDFLYIFYSKTCHQIDERSFHLIGEKVAVCSRCSSVYTGFLLSVALYPFIRGINNLKMPPLWFLIAASVFMVLDVFLDIGGIFSNTFISRAITGGIIGFILPFYLIPGTMNFANEVFHKYTGYK